MNRKLWIYTAVEAVIGRRAAWRLGRFLYLGSRRELVNDPRSNGEYALQDWMLNALELKAQDGAPTIFVDVGANLGDWTSHLVKTVGRRGLISASQIHAFEPAPDQRLSLCSSLSDEIKANTVIVHAHALGAGAHRARFIVPGPRAGTGAIATDNARSSGKEIEVEVSTFDAIARDLNIAKVALLKIDTEGNDFNVIVGARQMLENEKIDVVQFEYNWRWIAFGHWLKSVFTFIGPLNYSFGRLSADRIEIYSAWHPELERYMETNFVLVHRAILPRLPHCWMNFDVSNTPVEIGERNA